MVTELSVDSDPATRRGAQKLLCGLVFGLYATASAEEKAGDIALALAGMPMAEANTTDSAVCALPESGRCTTCPACCKKYSASVRATTDQSESASQQLTSHGGLSLCALLRLATIA